MTQRQRFYDIGVNAHIVFTVKASSADAASDKSDAIVEALENRYHNQFGEGVVYIEGWSVGPSDHSEDPEEY